MFIHNISFGLNPSRYSSSRWLAQQKVFKDNSIAAKKKEKNPQKLPLLSIPTSKKIWTFLQQDRLTTSSTALTPNPTTSLIPVTPSGGPSQKVAPTQADFRIPANRENVTCSIAWLRTCSKNTSTFLSTPKKSFTLQRR